MRPTTRDQFKEFCLRALGKGAIDINVTAAQVDDRLDEALDFWQQHHFESVEKVFYKHAITDPDKANGYIILPDEIVQVGRVLQVGTTNSLSPLTSIQYQIRLNDFFNFIDMSMIPYYMAIRRISELDEWLNAVPTFEYTRHTNKLILHYDWSRFTSSDYIVMEAWQIIDAPDLWADHWFQRYVTQLIKRQWGENLSKYSAPQVLGGITFNGPQLKSEAQNEIDKMETEVKDNLQRPLGFYIG